MGSLNPFLKLAEAYLKQARDRLEDARRALERGNNPYALRLSQECVELCLKASLRLIGVEYPKVHDVSDVLIAKRENFPEWFKKEIDSLAEISRRLASKRELSFYGGEEALLSPEELISREDAEKAVNSALTVFNLSQRLFNEYVAELG